jgi:hypothetical protein
MGVWPFAIIRPWFVRIVYGQLEAWEDARGNADDLAGPAFSRINESVSVYKVYGAVEEAGVVAACQLNRGQTPRKPILAIRFYARELNMAGLRVAYSPGETGVPWVDRAHRDISGNGASYRRLAEIILARQREGYDRARRMMSTRLLFQFRKFLSDDKAPISERAQQKCQELIKALDAGRAS